VYLMLANKLVHEVHNNAITIAEEVSGMPSRLVLRTPSPHAGLIWICSAVPTDRRRWVWVRLQAGNGYSRHVDQNTQGTVLPMVVGEFVRHHDNHDG
jgi:hypothetical protein